MKKSISLLGATLAMIGAYAQQSKMPNVVLIYADDIGFGDFSCYGATQISTPNVDALANNGMRFTNAHSAAATSTPSRYGLFTGEYPWRRKGTGVAAGNASLLINPERYTLPRMMKESGYITGAVGKWHLGLGSVTAEQDWNNHVSPGPYEIGFDYSYIMAATADRTPCVFMEDGRVVGLDPNDPIKVSYTANFPGEPTGKDNPELLTKLKPSLNHGHDQSIVNGISRIGYMQGGTSALWEDESIADSITLRAVNFIERSKDKPFFLYLGTNDIHVPRYPHNRFRGKSGMGLRGDALLQFDWTVSEVVRALKEAGIFENTIIIVSSDNGPVVDDGYDDGSVENLKNHKPWGPFRGGKYSSFEAGTRVPFIVHWPEKVDTGVSNALVSQIDMLGTLAEITGVEVDDSQLSDSRKELNTWLGKDKKGRDYVIGASSALTILTENWKYIKPVNANPYQKLTNIETGHNPKDQLYDMRVDRGEYDNVAENNQLVVSFLKQLIEEERSKGVGMDL